jgi:2-octaprenyl-6-methoxyphenol hydroxylase
MTSSRRFEAAVVGAGPAGLAAALSLGRLGVATALVGPPHRLQSVDADRRTAALFSGSIELLRNLGAWAFAAPESAPIAAIRLIDDRGALLRAPEVLFTAADIGLDVLGFNVPNGAIVSALRQAASEPASNLSIVDTAGVTRVAIGADAVRLTLAEGGEIEAGLVAGADGRRSLCREAAGISARTWEYPQGAVVCSFAHERAHRSISTEFHRAAGPCTTVPLPGRASSLVWVERREEAERLASLEEARLRVRLEEQLQGLLGSIGAIGPRSVFALSGLTAETFAANRIALVGEAAHAMAPIGAQGLNLGLRDAAALADCAADALRYRRDLGGPATLAAYTAARRPDVVSRVGAVDLLNRSLLSSLLPVHLARGLGLYALKALPALRRLVVREGVQPSFATPSLMQPDGITRLAERRGGSMVAA